MNTRTLPHASDRRICLPEGQVCSWAASRLHRLRNQTGTVWVTQEGAGDVVLHAGETYQARRSGRVVVESLHGEACLELTAA